MPETSAAERVPLIEGHDLSVIGRQVVVTAGNRPVNFAPIDRELHRYLAADADDLSGAESS